MFWYNLTIKQIIANNCKKDIFNMILQELQEFNKVFAAKINNYQIYYSQIMSVLNKDFTSEILDLPITFENIYYEYEEIISKNTSRFYFPGHLTYLYPYCKIKKATKLYTCHFDGEEIMPGREYICYRPLLVDLTTNYVYVVTPTLKVTTYYQDYLPKNITELEEFSINLVNGNERDLNFDDISKNLKCDYIKLKRLNR